MEYESKEGGNCHHMYNLVNLKVLKGVWEIKRMRCVHVSTGYIEIQTDLFICVILGVKVEIV